MTMNEPWKTEPDTLDFEAEGLRCAMRRNGMGAWCGYVAIGEDHPLYGLPINHPLKLPASWFERRHGLQGLGPIDLVMHAMSGKQLHEACQISLAFEVHGGLTYGGLCVRDDLAEGPWWFGFDCGHAGDLLPGIGRHLSIDMSKLITNARERKILSKLMERAAARAVYRDVQYVVGECQSLAAQLNAIVEVLQR